MGCTVAAVSAQRPVEHFKISRLTGCHTVYATTTEEQDRNALFHPFCVVLRTPSSRCLTHGQLAVTPSSGSSGVPDPGGEALVKQQQHHVLHSCGSSLDWHSDSGNASPFISRNFTVSPGICFFLRPSFTCDVMCVVRRLSPSSLFS